MDSKDASKRIYEKDSVIFHIKLAKKLEQVENIA